MSRGSGGLIGAPADAVAAANVADATAAPAYIAPSPYVQYSRAPRLEPSTRSLGSANAQSPKAPRHANDQAGRLATDFGAATATNSD